MHIGLVIRRLTGRNGEELSTAELADELARRGIRVTVLSAGPANAPANGRYEAVDLGVGRLDSSRQWVLFESRVRQESAGRSVDVVQSMGPPVECDVYQPRGGTVAETYARYLAMPRVWLDRWRARLRVKFSPSMRARLHWEQGFFARRPLPIIVPTSHYVARQLWHHYGLTGDRVRTVFGGIDVPTFPADQKARWRKSLREKLAADERTVLLFVGHQFEQKGLGYLLEALARAERTVPAGHARFALVVVGRDDPGLYKARAAGLGLSSPVHYVGQVAPEEVWAFYAAADVLVLPTVYDACSRTALEALALGTPVITTEHNGAGELVDQQGAGRLVHSAWAIRELADELVRAAGPDVLARWAESAARLGEYVSVRRMVDELMPIYEQARAARTQP